jgi:FimV-like protein
MILIDNGDATKGLAYINEALKLAPDAVELRLNHAKALVKTGDKAGARLQLQELAKHENAQVKQTAEDMLKTL